MKKPPIDQEFCTDCMAVWEELLNRYSQTYEDNYYRYRELYGACAARDMAYGLTVLIRSLYDSFKCDDANGFDSFDWDFVPDAITAIDELGFMSAVDGVPDLITSDHIKLLQDHLKQK